MFVEWLESLEKYFGPFRLFGYLSFRCMVGFIIAFVIGMVISPYTIRKLRELKCGQIFRTKEEVGLLAELHASKRNTPTMGGLIIFVSVMVSSILMTRSCLLVYVGLFVYGGLTALGFADDWKKVVKKSSEGVSGRVKLLVQGVITLVSVLLLYYSEKYSVSMRELYIPFMKNPIIVAMPFMVMLIFLFFVLAGSSNAVNLTDGVDGLAVGCTVSVAITYGVFAYLTGNVIASKYLFLSHIPESGELAVICCALVGGSMAFLWHNAHPAEVFMGDTGSLAIGGLIGIIAFMVHQPITLIIVGGVFVMEAISVILQVGSYKMRNKKRIFLCTPIHHHFEQKGWKETQVVIRFWLISLIFALGGIATLKIR